MGRPAKRRAAAPRLSARGGLAVPRKANFVIAEAAPVLQGSAEASEAVRLFGPSAKAVWRRNVTTTPCSNIKEGETEVGLFFGV